MVFLKHFKNPITYTLTFLKADTPTSLKADTPTSLKADTPTSQADTHTQAFSQQGVQALGGCPRFEEIHENCT